MDLMTALHVCFKQLCFFYKFTFCQKKMKEVHSVPDSFIYTDIWLLIFPFLETKSQKDSELSLFTSWPETLLHMDDSVSLFLQCV